MSRSYRKNPVIKDGGRSKKYPKNQANRRVRRYKKRDSLTATATRSCTASGTSVIGFGARR